MVPNKDSILSVFWMIWGWKNVQPVANLQTFGDHIFNRTNIANTFVSWPFGWVRIHKYIGPYLSQISFASGWHHQTLQPLTAMFRIGKKQKNNTRWIASVVSTEVLVVSNTPPKFNMEPENDGFQKESPFPGTSFQFHVKFQGCMVYYCFIFISIWGRFPIGLICFKRCWNHQPGTIWKIQHSKPRIWKLASRFVKTKKCIELWNHLTSKGNRIAGILSMIFKNDGKFICFGRRWAIKSNPACRISLSQAKAATIATGGIRFTNTIFARNWQLWWVFSVLPGTLEFPNRIWCFQISRFDFSLEKKTVWNVYAQSDLWNHIFCVSSIS